MDLLCRSSGRSGALVGALLGTIALLSVLRSKASRHVVLDDPVREGLVVVVPGKLPVDIHEPLDDLGVGHRHACPPLDLLRHRPAGDLGSGLQPLPGGAGAVERLRGRQAEEEADALLLVHAVEALRHAHVAAEVDAPVPVVPVAERDVAGVMMVLVPDAVRISVDGVRLSVAGGVRGVGGGLRLGWLIWLLIARHVGACDVPDSGLSPLSCRGGGG